MRIHTFAALAAGLLLGACGGGGSADTPLPTPDTSAVAATARPSALPAGWQDGVFMQVFVRAYQDSNGDGIGDLRGLTQRLDHLQQLGITGLWLMPIHPSQDGDHGYAVTDYRAVAPEYGTLADLDELLQQAHARGIGVILDWVMNHSAARHALFAQARSADNNRWRDWYVWQRQHPAGWSVYGSDPWRGTTNGSYYAPFWTEMPDFNLKNPAVVSWQQDNLRFWLNRGIDGLRVDAAGNLVENGPAAWEHQSDNHAVLAATRAVLDGYGGRYLVCEAPSLPQRYAASDSCGAAFAFGHQADLVSAARGDAPAVARVAAYPLTAPPGMALFASNHDGFAGQRVADQLGGDTTRLKLLAATYLLQARTAFVYYGEEIGMTGAAALDGDPKLRTPMSWTGERGRAGFTTGTPFRALAGNASTHHVAAQQADPDSLLSHYRAVIALRRAVPTLATGRYAHASSSGLALQFQRPGNDPVREGGAWVGINHGDTPVTLDVPGLAANTRLVRHWPTGASDLQADGAGRASVTLPGRSFAVFQIPPGATP
ncbi:alpha-amylase family glycosyl hydrolase [Sphaerotilus mobilis]|uniref:Glycosidase n=1 Tax=Sphaerotilus mobilis TaxID=47994 RepID=A0A4V2EW46_9BURK|nr:alpha-amylase family glycosyl hydrolase [Sphaerotilus mobilis]RZS54720.1 glycosidase [Sphaerotilus mobilis]